MERPTRSLKASMIKPRASAEDLGKVLNKLPLLRYFYPTLRLLYFLYKTGTGPIIYKIPPGHFHSPIPNIKEVLARSQVLFDHPPDDCLGIDLKVEAQLKLLECFSDYYDVSLFSPTPTETSRFYYQNTAFGYADAIVLYSIMRHFGPQRVIEIGSGFSSAAMLDISDRFLEKPVQFTFIEPCPQILLSLLTQEDKDRQTIFSKQVQDVPLEVFHTLSANDILFVDGSHVARIGSDVVHILFHILPRLRPGVIVHF